MFARQWQMDFIRNCEMTSLDFISFEVGENTVWHKLSLIVFHTGNVTSGQTAKLHGSGLLFGGLRIRLVDMLDREVYVLKDTTVPKMIVLYQHY